MKKTITKQKAVNILSTLLCSVLLATITHTPIAAQSISSYSFTQSAGAYTAIVGGSSALGAGIDDASSTVQNIGFTFTYHGAAYTTFFVQSNGYMSLGGSSLAQNYTPLGSVVDCIAFMGGDGRSGASGITYAVSGTIPNRVLTVQFANQNIYYGVTSETVDAQIQLFETTNVIQIVYGSSTHTASYTRQMGLTGASAADFNVRTTSTDWSATTVAGANTATMTWSATVFPASGQTYTWTPPAVCAGAPAVSTTISSVNPACTGINFTLSLGTAYNATGITYQWQSSPDGIIYTDISGATSTTCVTSLTADTYYQCVVTCTSGPLSTISNPLLVGLTTGAPCLVYCTSTATSTFDEDLGNVTVGGMNNTSVCGVTAPGPGSVASMYSNFRTSVAPGNITQGATEPFSVSVLQCNGGSYTNQFKIYIDYNQNGSFLDAGEEVASVSGSAAWTGTGTFIVPNTALTGNTVMRVVAVEGTVPGPCSTYSWGETEDYLINIVASVPCAGTPAPGNTISTDASICSAINFTLSLQNTVTGSGITYQWQSSSDGITYADISGATSETLATTQTSATYYQCVVTCTSGPTFTISNPLLVGLTTGAPCLVYCTSTATSTFDEDLGNVTVGGMNNTSVCGVAAPGPGSVASMYSNFRTSVAPGNITQGATQPFSVSVLQCNGGSYTNQFKIYIDYNQNGSFLDAGEEVASMSGSAAWTGTGTFVVPYAALTGNTVMRVIAVEGTVPGPCSTYSWGETEDYLINIVAAVPCSGTPAPGNTISSLASVCSGISFDLSLQNTITGSGITYQWQSSPDGITYSNIVGATSSTYTTTQTVATYYYCEVTCASGPNSALSTPLLVGLTTGSACLVYCQPTMFATNGCNYINSTTTSGAITNITTAVDAGYNGTGSTFFNSPVITQMQGNSFTLTVQAQGFCAISYYYVWVDWNQNGTFDSGEMVINNGAFNTGNSVTNFTINIPYTASVGSTRMRIICWGTNSPTPGPCDDLSAYYGETEDYSLEVTAAPPCAGVPAPGNTIASVDSICSGINFDLSLQNLTTGSGVTYQWQSSADGITYTNIAGANAPTLTTSQTVATYYYCVVTCTAGPDSTLSSPLLVGMTTGAACLVYCTSYPTNTSDEEIFNVTVGTLNNTSSCGTTGGPGSLINQYSDYTTIVAAPDLMEGSSISYSVDVNTCGGLYNNGVAIWIDFNQNGLFTDPGEQVFVTPTTTNGIYTVSGTFTVPVGGPTGITRMRVTDAEGYAGSSLTPCLVYGYGETEDYFVNIIPGPYDMGILNLTAPVSPACYTSTEYVTATVKNFGAGPIDLSVNPVTVSCSVTGPNPVTFTPIVLNTGIIALGATQTVTFSTNYDMSVTGTYTFTTSTSVASDATSGNDTFTTSFVKYDNPSVVASANTVSMCVGSTTGMMAIGTSNTGIVSYTWTPATGLNSTSSQFPFATPPSTTTYTMTVIDVNGCAASDTALITVHQLPNVVANASTTTPCIGSDFTLYGSGADTYIWDNGVTDNVPFAATFPITYNVTGTDIYGCSNFSSVNIAPNSLPYITASASQNPVCVGNLETLNGGGGATYVWDNGVTDNTPFTASSTTTFNVIGTDTNGCQGSASILLTVNPVSTSSQSFTVCAGDSITVGTSTYLASGIYTDVFINYLGCDSTVTTNLTVSPAIAGSQSPILCAGGNITVGANTYSVTGVFTDVLVAFNGCDSTVTTNLTVLPAVTGSQVLILCDGGSVTVGANTYTTTGIYTDVFVAGAFNGCDSTATTDLTILPPVTASQTITLCYGGSITVGGNTYTSAGIYTDVFVAGAFNGCDSTVTTNLTVNPDVTFNQTINVCYGGSVTVGGNTYTANGTYVDVLTGTALSGCDSTVTTNFTVGAQIANSQTMTLCAGDSLVVGASVYHTSGTYTDILSATNGCDSTITSNLTVALPLTGTQTFTLCAGDSVVVGSIVHNATGVFNDILVGSAGCDSTVTTNLTVNPVYANSQSFNLCSGDSVVVGSHTYNATGVYTDVYTAMGGCDSTVTTNLTINAPVVITVNSATICAGQTVTLTAGGATSFAWSVGATSSGVSSATATPSASATYTVTGTTGSCTGTAISTVTVNPLPSVTLAAFNPDTVCVNWATFALPTGTPVGGVYTGAGVSGTNYNPTTAGVGTHVVTYTYTNGSTTCAASANTNITVNSCTGVEEYGFTNSISVYPNPTSGMFNIFISNADFTELLITVSDVQGRLVYNLTDKNITSNYNKQIDLEGLAKGIYYIRLSNGSEVKIQKLVIE